LTFLILDVVERDELKLIEFTDLTFFLIDGLIDESQQEGYEFIQRTIEDWNSGANKFSKPGEKLWGLMLETTLIGIGGLNYDPYSEYPNLGRVRHLYIRKIHRRKGYATLLMNTIISEARQYFDTLRLLTDNPAASELYETLGFQKINGPKVSLVLNF
jgi:GNAT superfamily N-acetyltransferase